jgi:hypothetical protein
MTAPRWINAALVLVIVAIMSTAHLLDGPTEIDAMRATAASKQDAIKSAATQASNMPARGQKDFKTVIAGVKP